MSMFEIAVICIVCLLVMKPEDIPKILKKFREMKAFISDTKREIVSHLDINTAIIDKSGCMLESEVEQINFYLGKIADQGAEYDGEYDLTSIKKYYRKIMNEKNIRQSDAQ